MEDRVHLHRFLWHYSGKDGIGEYAITRVTIGDKPTGCIAQLAMQETTNLPIFNHHKKELGVVQEEFDRSGTAGLSGNLKTFTKTTAAPS